MDATALLAFLILAFIILIVLSKKEQHLEEDEAKVRHLAQSAYKTLGEAVNYIGEEKVPRRIMNELESSLCKLMCNVRRDKEESTQVSVLYGHFKHVLDEFLEASPRTKEYTELKEHLEEQYDHIQHELAEIAHKRGLQLAGAHEH